jgi:hypothetical protein
MIKNIIYSLLLHLVLFLIIYANFNLKTFKEEEVQEITVSLTTLSGDGKVNKVVEEIKPEEKPKEEVKIPEVKEEKAPKKDEKKEVKKKEQKQEKAPEKKTIAKPKIIEKAKPIKQVEKAEEKKPIVEKPKEDKVINKKKDEVENNKKKEEIIKDKEKSDEIKEKQAPANAIKSDVEEVANTIENLNLSPRQKLNIRSQLGRCYKKATDDLKPQNKIIIKVKVNIDNEGYIKSNLEETVDKARYATEKDYKITIDNVRRALEFCSPLRNLPSDKFDILKEVVLEFDEDKIVEN